MARDEFLCHTHTIVVTQHFDAASGSDLVPLSGCCYLLRRLVSSSLDNKSTIISVCAIIEYLNEEGLSENPKPMKSGAMT